MFVWTCTKKFWQDCRNFVSKNTKEFPIVQIRWSYNFFIRNCFHQKWFSSNGECIFDNPTKNFSPKNQKTTDFSLRFQKRKREIMFFWKENLYSSNCASAHVESICDTPWKICCQNSEKFLLEFPKGWKTCALSKQNNFSPKCSFEHAQWIFGKPAVTLLTRIRQTFLNSKNVEDTFFWTNLFF